MARVIKYDNLYIGNISLYPDGKFEVPTRIYRESSKNAYGKWAVIGLSSPQSAISSRCTYQEDYVTPGNNIYISGSSKISRAVVRNSQYKIKIDSENAVATVIPVPQPGNYEFKYNIAFLVINSNSLYLMSFEDTYYIRTNVIPDEKLEEIKKYLESRFGKENIEWVDISKDEKQRASTIEKVDEYVDIICDTHPHRKYVFDTKLHLIPSTEITVETLQIWKSMESRLICSCLESSDWQKYPVTICAFLAAYRPRINYGATPQLNRILREIKYSEFINGNYDNITITPEDLCMLGKWISFQLGVSEQGGFIESNKQISEVYRKFYRRKIAIKPLTIDAPMSLSNLTELSKG